MLRGYRSILAALAGLGATTAFVLVILDLASVSRSIQQQAAHRADIYQQDARADKDRRCLRLPFPAGDECARQADQTARENQRVELDLSAQQVTAWWTQVMGMAALIGMALSAIGVWLVWTTFREARRAANAGFEANSIAQNSQRARLVVRPKISVAYMNAEPEATIYVENVGYSIALNAVCRLGATTDIPDAPFGYSEESYAHEIGAGKSGSVTKMENVPIGSIISGYVEYRTIFSGPHFTYFCFRVASGPRGFGGEPCKPNHWPADT